MKYSNELLESGLLDKFFPKASFYAVCDWLNKRYEQIKLDLSNFNKCETVIDVFSNTFVGFIKLDKTNEVCFYNQLHELIYKPNLDNQFDLANQYD